MTRSSSTPSATVARSPLSWTVVRCPGMTNGPPRGVRHVGRTHRDTVGSSVTRQDAARFLAAQVLETNYVCASPAISN
ncbi:NAD(P)H-binding protein [Kocuria kalidii]|uniref:NAD(P)H-binding protein n=1 Tax=Kocuria kalidii TaxID=3376283 RepID=UPI0037BA7CD4